MYYALSITPRSKNKLAYNQKLLNSKEQDATKLEFHGYH